MAFGTTRGVLRVFFLFLFSFFFLGTRCPPTTPPNLELASENPWPQNNMFPCLYLTPTARKYADLPQCCKWRERQTDRMRESDREYCSGSKSGHYCCCFCSSRYIVFGMFKIFDLIFLLCLLFHLNLLYYCLSTLILFLSSLSLSQLLIFLHFPHCPVTKVTYIPAHKPEHHYLFSCIKKEYIYI